MHIQVEAMPLGDLGLARVGLVSGMREWLCLAATLAAAAVAASMAAARARYKA